MLYSKLSDVYGKLEGTTKKLEKRDILAYLYKECSEEELHQVVLFSMGTVIITADDLGVAEELMRRIIAKTYGVGDSEIARKFKELGDLGKVAEFFAGHRRQRMLGHKELTIEHVFKNVSELPKITGSGSQDRKVGLISELLTHATSKEARYIVRTVLGDMRIGVAHGTVRDAIAKAFDKEPKDVEHSWNVTGDFGKVAEMARRGRMRSEISIFTPVRVMLADRSPDLETALQTFETPAVEIKLDGFRAQIHKRGNDVKIFSRRLDEVTKQFPEVVRWSKECLHARDCIVEGEIVAVDPKTGSPQPFQHL
ncbi:MAG: DNA ligase, partial [Candidatus Aenigmatarchaeota archaeon]